MGSTNPPKVAASTDTPPTAHVHRRQASDSPPENYREQGGRRVIPAQSWSSRHTGTELTDYAHKEKMIKRQMFGRVKLPLLRKRFLLAAAQDSYRHRA